MLPTLLREAGYYTSKNRERDCNMGGDDWHGSSDKARWRHRPSLFNLTECHSSITRIPDDEIAEERLFRPKPEDSHDPHKASIPPDHPDVPQFRRACACYYDAVIQVDYPNRTNKMGTGQLGLTIARA